MVWKVVNNSDSGTATKHGGNDLDKIASSFNGNNVSDPIIFKTDLNTLKHSTTNIIGDLLKHTGTKFDRFAKGTANQVLRTNAAATDLEWATIAAGGDITGGTNVGTGTGQVFKDKSSNNLNFKTLLAGSNITITNNTSDITIASTGGGGGGATTLDELADVTMPSSVRGDIIVRGASTFQKLAKGTPSQVLRMNTAGTDPEWATVAGASAAIEAYTYFIYKDPADSLYKAKKGIDGSVLSTTSATNVTAVLDAVVADISPPTTPAVVEFAAGDFPMTTVFNNITVPVIGNLVIRGQGMGATTLTVSSAVTSGSVFEIFGATSGSQTTLTANCTAGDRTIAVTSAASFAAGDTILLRSNAAFSTASSAQGKKGEIHKIISIATNTITLDKWTHDSYATADTANIIKLTMQKNITIQDLTLKGGSGYTGSGDFFKFQFCDNIRIERIHCLNHAGSFSASMHLASCINWDADIVLEQSPTNTFNNQYGFKPTSASENGKVNIVGIGKFRHLFTCDASSSSGVEGQVRNISISGSGETNDEACWDTHATGEGFTFINCTFNGTRNNAAGGDAKGFQMRAKSCAIIGCMTQRAAGKGITLMEDALNSLVSGCQILNTRALDDASLGFGIEIRSGANNCTITGNVIKGSAKEGILIRTTSGGHVITGNCIQSNGNEGIEGADISNTIVSGNRITGNSKAINMTGTSDGWVITGNATNGNTSAWTTIGAATITANNTVT